MSAALREIRNQDLEQISSLTLLDDDDFEMLDMKGIWKVRAGEAMDVHQIKKGEDGHCDGAGKDDVELTVP